MTRTARAAKWRALARAREFDALSCQAEAEADRIELACAETDHDKAYHERRIYEWDLLADKARKQRDLYAAMAEQTARPIEVVA